jgi:hypothetical protein
MISTTLSTRHSLTSPQRYTFLDLMSTYSYRRSVAPRSPSGLNFPLIFVFRRRRSSIPFCASFLLSARFVSGLTALDLSEGGFLNMSAMEWHFDAISARCICSRVLHLSVDADPLPYRPRNFESALSLYCSYVNALGDDSDVYPIPFSSSQWSNFRSLNSDSESELLRSGSELSSRH